jgi:hypothetical protein
MKNLILILTTTFTLTCSATAQNYLTKNGTISFFSKTSVENIDAVNNQAVSVLNSQTGDIAFSILITGFLFKKALMQEHFNENYMESQKFPKGSFKGTITDIGKVDFKKNGTYSVSVTGDLSLHGETNKITIPATLQVKGKSIIANASFNVKTGDYKITIPKVVENNISKSIAVTVDCKYEAR